MAVGSLDAAATIVGFDYLSSQVMSRDKMEEMAAPLGSDVPSKLRGGTALGTGHVDQ